MSIIELYKNLIIFDSKGDPIPKVLSPDGHYTSNLNLNKHSVFIPEHLSLYIMEKFYDVDKNMINVKSVVADAQIKIDIYGDGYNFYEVAGENSIEKRLYSDIPKNISEKILNEDGYDDSGIIEFFPKTVNVIHIGEVEDIFDGKIDITINGVLLWSIVLYTETEDEDERYVQLLENIGEDVTNRHEIIFRHSDINEDLPNAMILNEKRKEFLTVINDITPYISSVRGIYQIIDFFDYKNVIEVKEYWYNPIEDKIRIIPITEIYKDTTDIKLQQFGLFYKINEPTEELDDLGLPVLKDNFLISHEEILVKLFALKEYFIEKDYGGISDIVDIIGEIYNYQLIAIRHWRTTSDLAVYDHIPVASFEVDQKDYYIDPIKKVYDTFLESYLNLADIGDYKIYEVGNHTFTHFKGFMDDSIRLNDDGLVEIGAQVSISNSTFKNRMKDLNYSWNAMSVVDIFWHNAYAPNFYNVQYIINRNLDSVITDGRTFNSSYSGSLRNMTDITVTLPYDGFYDVTMILTGYDGVVTSSYVKKAIEVKLRDPNFMFFFKVHDVKLQNFKTNDLTWGDINQEFCEVINYNNNLTSVNDTITPRYSAIDYWDIGGRILKQDFKSSKFTFKDYSLITWGDTSYESEEIQRFIYSGIIKDSTLQVGKTVVTIPDINIHEYNYLEKVFKENLDDSYEYTHRERLNHNLIEGVYKHIDYDGNIFIGSSEDNLYSKDKMEKWSDFNHTFESCPLEMRNMRSVVKPMYKPNAFTVANTKTFMNEVDLPAVIPLFMGLENANVYGKVNAKWEISKDGAVVHSAKGLMTAHQFKEKGLYTVKIEILDKNGNVYKLTKNNIINIISDYEYLNTYKHVVR